MAVRIDVSFAKKIPIPGVDYASQQASITVSGEITDLNQISNESAKLFAAAEAVVDRQLNISHAPPVSTQSPATTPSATAQSPTPNVQPATDAAARSARPYAGKSRAMATSSQLRFLDSLIKSTRTDGAAILQEFEIGSLTQLSCRDAARLIDDLKSKSIAR